MALFKPFRGTRASLPQELHDGYAYFCTDDGSFHIDFVDAEGNLQRKQINAKDAETLMGMSLDEIKKYVAVQSDWGQNDETAADYIKNRTHYSTTEEETKTWSWHLDNSGGWMSGTDLEFATLLSQYYTNVEITIDGSSDYYMDENYNIVDKTSVINTLYVKLTTDDNGAFTGAYKVGEHSASWSSCSISIPYSVENIVPLDEKYIPDTIARVEDIPEQVQSDWSVNDETNPAYVKNRTHWKNDPIETVFLEETTVEVHGYAQVSTSLHFELGETYTVMFNGEKYECVAWDGEGEAVCIGNGSIYGGEGLGGNEPFSCDSYNHDGCYLNVAEDGIYTISISKIVTEIHKLPIEFLPDEVLAKPDWNADEGEHGYVLNRTHYIEEVLEEVIPETTVTFGDATIPGYDTGTATGGSIQILPEYGEMFVVEWNGQKYYSEVGEYTKQDGSFGQGVGNTGMFGGMIRDEYPFLIGFLTEEEAAAAGHTYIVWVNDGSTDATFSVGKVGEAVHRLDAKYLPENIATNDYVDAVIAAIKPKSTTITIPAANWTGDMSPWSQVVTVNGVTANSKVDLQPSAQQIVSLQNSETTLMTSNDGGVITVWAIGTKPEVDYTMQVLITEVTYV